MYLESGRTPAFASSDARLDWTAADSHERSTGRLVRSLTAAPPNSLDFAGRLELARNFAARVTAGQLPYTPALHVGIWKEAGAANDPHLHLVFAERVNDGMARGRAVVPTGGAEGGRPGVRGREEERAHEAASVAGGDAAGVGGGDDT